MTKEEFLIESAKLYRPCDYKFLSPMERKRAHSAYTRLYNKAKKAGLLELDHECRTAFARNASKMAIEGELGVGGYIRDRKTNKLVAFKKIKIISKDGCHNFYPGSDRLMKYLKSLGKEMITVETIGPYRLIRR